MRLAISGQLLGGVMSLEEIFKIMKAHEVNSIELWPANIPIIEEGVPFQGSRYEGRNIKIVKELASQYKMNIACVTMPGAFNKEISSSLTEYSAALKYTVAVAHELGARVVNHYCYNLSMTEHLDMSFLLKVFEPAIREAQELGITLALENEAHDSTRKPEGMLKLLKSIDSPVFKTNFDATNYYHASEEAFPYAYEVLKEYIAYVHIKNGCIFNPEFYLTDSCGSEMSGANKGKFIYYPTVAKGAVNIDGLLKRLELDGYKGYCTLEPHTKPEHVQRYYDEEIPYLCSKGVFNKN